MDDLRALLMSLWEPTAGPGGAWMLRRLALGLAGCAPEGSGAPPRPHKDLQRQGEWMIEAIYAATRLPECDREGTAPRAYPAHL